jgi:ABC-type lipoprotein export system ATPase subunit
MVTHDEDIAKISGVIIKLSGGQLMIKEKKPARSVR